MTLHDDHRQIDDAWRSGMATPSMPQTLPEVAADPPSATGTSTMSCTRKRCIVFGLGSLTLVAVVCAVVMAADSKNEGAGTTATTTTTTTSNHSTPSPSGGDFVKLSIYPGYKGELEVEGSVSFSAEGKEHLMFEWALWGLEEKKCAGYPPAGVANACGIHIHEGRGCKGADEVGGHYFDSETFTIDPWADICYKTGEFGGESRGSATVIIGESFDSIEGRAFVVHDSAGARVACGEISAEKLQLLFKTDTAGSVSNHKMAYVLALEV